MKKIWPYLVLTIIVLVFLNRGLTNKAIFFGADETGSDLLHSAYPEREFFQTEFFKNGEMPLWIPYLSSGIPFFGEAQVGVYYLPVIILFGLLPAMLAFNLMTVLVFLLMAWGFFLYSRHIGLGQLGAFFASITFTLSGFMVGHLRHVSLESTLIVLPYLLLVVDKIITQKRLLWMIILSFLVFFSLAPGHLPSSYFLFVFVFIYFLLRLSFSFKKEGKEELKPILIFIGGFVLGIFLSCAIWFPVIEQTSLTSRVSFGVENSLTPPYKFQFLRLFIQPFAYGDPSRGTWNIWQDNYWENIGYVGLLPLMFAFIGFKCLKNEQKEWKNIYGLMGLISLLLLLGFLTPFYNLVWQWIPGFSFTRAPGRFLFYLDFSLCIMAGFGFQHFLEKIKNKKKIIAGFFIIFITLIDLFAFGYHFNNVMPANYFDKPKSVEFLEKDPDLFRIRSLGYEEAWYEAWQKSKGWTGDLNLYFEQRELIPPDGNLSYRISSSAIMYGLAGRFVPSHPSELDAMIINQLDKPKVSKLLGLENVKYLLSFKPTPDNEKIPLLTKIPVEGSEKEVFIYQNLEWLPRAYMVKEAVVVENKEQVFNIMQAEEFNPQEQVILEKSVDRPIKGEGTVKILTYENNKVVLEADSKEGGFLVLSDTYYPGWVARVNGVEQEILQANYNYRALALESGVHKVVFSFEPKSVKYGQLISLGTLGVLVLFGGICWLKRL